MIEIPPAPTINEDQPTLPQGPEGAQLVSMFRFPISLELAPDDDVRTVQYEFFSARQLTQEHFYNAMLEGILAMQQGGLTVAAYYVWEQVALDVRVPNRFCLGDACFDVPARLCLPGTEWCIELAGRQLANAYRYRVWLLVSATHPEFLSADLRPALPVLGVLALGAVIISVLAVVIGVFAVFSGQMKARELLQEVRKFVSIGENVRPATEGLSWPFFALGLALVAGGIVLPAIAARGSVSVPLGGAQVQVGGELGGAGGGRGRR